MSDFAPSTNEISGVSVKLRRAAATLLTLVPIIVLAVLGAVLVPNLGRRMATHWSVSGAPDQFGDSVVTLWIFGSLVAALTVGAIVVLAVVRDGAVARFASGLVVAITAILAVAWIGPALATAAVIRPEDARLGWSILMLIPAAALGVAVGALVPRGNREHQPADAVSTLTLRPGERVAWVGTAGSRIFAIGGILIAIVCAAVGTVALASAQLHPGQSGVGQSGAGTFDATSGPIIALTVGVLAGLSVVMLARVRLFVDSRGVRLVSAIFGVPLMRIRLADVAGVRVEMIEPARWGGWGYRFSTAGRAYVTRRRPGIVVTTHRGGTSAITIDNASGAASVLQALLDR